MFSLLIGWNAGYRFNFATAMVPAVSALFYMLGHILPKNETELVHGNQDALDPFQRNGVGEDAHAKRQTLQILFAAIVTDIYSYTEFKKRIGS